MLVQLPTIPLFFALLLFLFMLVKHLKSYNIRRGQAVLKKLPPGPWKLPFIGNLHQLISSHPHHTLRNLAKKYGPIMHLQVGDYTTIVISSKELAEEALKTHDHALAQRPENLALEIVSYKDSGIAFAPYGNYWKQLRKICVSHILSTKKVQYSYRKIREEEVFKFISSISTSPQGQVVNLSNKIRVLTNSIISRALFGEKLKYQDEIISLAKEQVELGGAIVVPAIFPSLKFLQYLAGIKNRLENIQRRMDKILDNILDEHRTKREKEDEEATNNAKPREEDFIDVLLRLQASANDLEFSITTNTIKALVSDIFVGGSGNPSTTIEWAMAEMMRNPRVMEKAQVEVRQVINRKRHVEEIDIQQLHYLKSVIKETLRLHPPIPLLPREARESFEINGFEVPFMAKVVINLWAISRDPKYWIDPDCFLPERFLDSAIYFQGLNYEYIPFGAGRRMCPGISFGISYIELSLAHLLYHFDWKLPTEIKPEKLDMTELFAVTTAKRNHLLVIPNPYKYCD